MSVSASLLAVIQGSQALKSTFCPAKHPSRVPLPFLLQMAIGDSFFFETNMMQLLENGRGKRLSAVNTNLSARGKRADGVNAPFLQLEWIHFNVETLQRPCKDITLHRGGVCVLLSATQPSFYLLFSREVLPCPPELPVPLGALPAPELCSKLGSARFSPLTLRLLSLLLFL